METEQKKFFKVGDEVIFRNDFSLLNCGRVVEYARNNQGEIVEYIIMTINSELSIVSYHVDSKDIIRKVLGLNVSELSK